MAAKLKVNFNTFRATDPVALHLLHIFRPFKFFKISKQAIGISGDFQYPLPQGTTDNGIAVSNLFIDLFIGKNGF